MKNMANIQILVKISIPPATFFIVSVFPIKFFKKVCFPCPTNMVTAMRKSAWARLNMRKLMILTMNSPPMSGKKTRGKKIGRKHMSPPAPYTIPKPNRLAYADRPRNTLFTLPLKDGRKGTRIDLPRKKATPMKKIRITMTNFSCEV